MKTEKMATSGEKRKPVIFVQRCGTIVHVMLQLKSLATVWRIFPSRLNFLQIKPRPHTLASYAKESLRTQTIWGFMLSRACVMELKHLTVLFVEIYEVESLSVQNVREHFRISSRAVA